MFIDKEIEQAEQAHLHYAVAHQRTKHLESKAKRRIRLLMAKPSMILTIFALGAFKGATSSKSPDTKRRHALMTFARTAFFKFIM